MKAAGIYFCMFIMGACLAGCSCAGTCDCFDEFDCSISLLLNTDAKSSKAWSQQELIGTYLLEVDSQNQTSRIVDFIRTTDTLPNRKKLGLSIENSEGVNTEAIYHNPCVYMIMNDSLSLNITITDIYTKGSRDNSLCCKCYTNEYVKFSVNGMVQEFAGDDRSGATYTIQKP